MMKTLVLAEKPSVGKDIARVLHCSKNINGGLEGKQYIVTWALGHLVTLADPEKYDDKYQTWKLEDLPIMPDKMKTVVIKQTAHQYNNVKKLLERKDIKDIIIATDAGREGELVARWIIYKTHVKKPMKRLWISSVTDKAIKEGFQHLKDASCYDALYYSAYSRSVADWLVGINASRALTCKYNAQLNCGRVQTPTLAMIAMQEDKIRNFKPKTHYGIQILADNQKWTYTTNKNEIYLFNEKIIDNIIYNIKNKSLEIKDIKTTHKKKQPPLLYDLTELQRDANKIYGFSASQTLDIMQSLYEYHKVLTYPRTDSRYLTDDIVPTLKERLQASLGGDYDNIIHDILAKPIIKKKHYVNNNKVNDHHAIIPTEESPYFGQFNDAERKIYDLVLKRFLSVLMDDYQYNSTTITATIDSYHFKLLGITVTQLGFQQLYKTDEENTLPLYQIHQKLDVITINKLVGQTNPPSYFNEASLLSAMENPTNFMQGNQSLNRTLVETGGLGTVATRADIIDKLFNSYLIEKHGQDIHITNKGKQLLNLVPDDLKSPELTAKWEQELFLIAHKKKYSNDFINEIREYTVKLINEIKINNSQGTYRHDNMTHKKCPKCGHYLLEVNGKKGKRLVCSSRECYYKENISIITNARCPNCHKKLELVGKDDKQMFVCKTCGYRITMKQFKKDRKTRQNTANKGDVKKYLKKQNQNTQDIEDSPFAALLSIKDNLK
ncbi:MAG: DNA topoisomerase III [Erysipelotrichaceae bacterium]|nr:DNA topoisomerase III [Erysipelotrichaceae bacterium]